MSAPSLSLFSPPEEPTLLELYPLHWEHLRGKGTRACDLEALRFFDRLHPQTPSAKLTFEHTRRARRELDLRVKEKKISANQANKIGRHLNRFLALLGPNDGSIDPEDPLALQPLGILPAPLRMAVPPAQKREVEGWIEIEESSAFLSIVAHARWINPVTGRTLGTERKRQPPQLSAPHWWQCCWTFIYNSALRIDEATQVLWEDRRTDKHGEWLHVRPEVSKTGDERLVYLNRHALAALERLRTCGHVKIMAWDYSLSFLDRLRRDLFERANLHRLLEQEIGWHGLRKACATELISLCGREGSRASGLDLAAKHLGHVLKSVTAGHYMHRSAVIPYVDRLPQPAICELPPVHEDKQLKLFD